MKSKAVLTHLVLLACLSTTAAGAEAVGTVHGSGIFGTTRGELPNHQPFIDKITVNATLFDDGAADGSIVWVSTYNGQQDPGQGTSGWGWRIRVEGWWMEWDGSITVYGTVTHSTWSDEVVGFGTWVNFYDGGTSNPDTIFGNEIHGNIRFSGP